MNCDPPVTPLQIKKGVRVTCLPGSPAVHLPPTPALTKLGYGTGVSVFLYPRSPGQGVSLRSPWAVKKVNRRHARSEFGARLEEEAKVLKQLSHPNIIGYRAFKPSGDGVHALMME